MEIDDQPELPPARWDHDGHDPAAASRIRLGRSLSVRLAVRWRPRGWLLRGRGRGRCTRKGRQAGTGRRGSGILDDALEHRPGGWILDGYRETGGAKDEF